MIEFFDNMLRTIHYIHDWRHLSPLDEPVLYAKLYKEYFGNKPDFEEIGDGWNARYRNVIYCPKCGASKPEEVVALI